VKRAVIWDLDGVLVDSHRAHFRAWESVAAEYDLPFDERIFTDTFGMNNHGVLTRWLGERWTLELERKMARRKEVLYRQEVKRDLRALPGALDWLSRLRRAGWRQALGSSAPWANIDVVLDGLGLREYLDAVCSGQDLSSKPDPALFLSAARALGVAPTRCVVVEDAPTGIEAARRARMRCVAVTTTHGVETFGDADVVTPTLDALLPDTFDRLVARA
jgi:beta-phosphoglucomutase